MIDQEMTRRMDAYRGNPQALAQKYQQNQQLIDLLALQKLKSEKEAAMRSLQMQGGGEGGLPTIAQQREQEVMDMTREEVAKQVGQTGQQKQQGQEQALKNLLSGIASAPGAANVMSQPAMAAGGIVAFQGGGKTEESYEEERLAEDNRRRILAEAPAVAPIPTASVVRPQGSATETGLLELIRQQQEEAARRPGMTPEALAARQEGIASARGRMEREFNPEKQRIDQLIAFLTGAGGRTSIGSTLASGARSAQALGAQQEAAQRERVKEVSGLEEALRQRQEADTLAQYQAKQTARKDAIDIHSKLVDTATRIAGQANITDAEIASRAAIAAAELGVRISEGQLNRIVEEAKVEVQRQVAGKQTDPTQAVAAYAAEFMRLDPTMTKTEADGKAWQKYQDNINLGKTSPEQRGINSLTRDDNYKQLSLRLSATKDPDKRKAIEDQLKAVYAVHGVPYATPAAAGAPTQTYPAPSSDAVKFLRDGKGTPAQFDAQFGPGAAAKAMGR